MAMKWNHRSQRELEILFDTGSKVLHLDRQAVAAELHLPDGNRRYLRTARPLPAGDLRLIDIWFGSQPRMIQPVPDSAFDEILNKEHNK